MRILENKNDSPMLRAMRVTTKGSDEGWMTCDSGSDSEDEPVRLQAMRTTKGGAPIEFRSTVRWRDGKTNSQPDRDPNKSAVLCGMVEVAGHLAYSMFDSGSTTNGMMPEYSHILRTPKVVLEEQVVLQLGCSGSRSKINFGTRAPVSFGPVQNTETYFDVVNLDRYDCVFGTPFMNEHGVNLDFKTREIVIRGQRIAAFTHEEDAAFRANRWKSRPEAGSANKPS